MCVCGLGQIVVAAVASSRSSAAATSVGIGRKAKFDLFIHTAGVELHRTNLQRSWLKSLRDSNKKRRSIEVLKFYFLYDHYFKLT